MKIITTIIAVYLLLGCLVSVYVLLNKKLQQIDKATINTSFIFKCLLFPGSVVLWPLLIKKLKRNHES